MLLDWLYPRYCELCRRPGSAALCSACMKSLPRIVPPFCLSCGAPVINGREPNALECNNCRRHHFAFDFARSACPAEESTLQLIHRIKYHRANYLAYALAHLLRDIWDDTPELRASGAEWCIVPVPAARRHLYARGYNQAEELARALAELRGSISVCTPLIRRQRAQDSQTRLSASERRKNAGESYALLRKYGEGRRRLPAGNVVLVDDVYTTGSTCDACSRLLRRIPGVKRIGVLTVLRAIRQRT